jgi:hypothetical protein
MSVSTKIRMSPTDKCSTCGRTDAVLHRLTECGAGPAIRHWTTQKIALMLPTIPNRIWQDWLLRPQCALWTPTRRHATLWMLVSFVLFQIQSKRELTQRDFIEFVQRNKWSVCQAGKRRWLVANYLTVLDMIWERMIITNGIKTRLAATLGARNLSDEPRYDPGTVSTTSADITEAEKLIGKARVFQCTLRYSWPYGQLRPIRKT